MGTEILTICSAVVGGAAICETVAIFYGINPRTLEVESVYVTRDGHMTKHRTYNGEPTIHDHYSVHGNSHEVIGHPL
jgi:hypothetical protein